MLDYVGVINFRIIIIIILTVICCHVMMFSADTATVFTAVDKYCQIKLD